MYLGASMDLLNNIEIKKVRDVFYLFCTISVPEGNYL